MHLDHLTLTDFRSYTDAEFEPAAAGITVVTGANGAGKTNLIEAVAYLATLRSLRGAPAAAVIRSGCDQAVLRSRVRHDARLITIDAEVHAAGRDRVQVNGQPLRRTRDLLGALQVTVFSPDDLALVKAAPAGRREYLDDLMVALQPRRDSLLTELERVLKQRNALLKSVFSTGWRPGRPLPEDVRVTLDVWDSKLVAVGEALVEARSALARDLTPHVATAYSSLATGSAPPARLAVALAYEVSWPGALRDALVAAREDDLRRGVTTVGPQRDDLRLDIGGLPARTHASQGEQRTLALALRLAGHRLVAAAVGSPPLLLLDDVFSELDGARAEALMANLPALSDTQAILTTAGALPPGALALGAVAARFRVEEGKLLT
ncbi:MAG TPA: DNA replication/repair protein RecF [Acidimicrobiales bacterium]|nr:DNA replication/repair protein RecF [Acidimicrobiales bacterium]